MQKTSFEYAKDLIWICKWPHLNMQMTSFEYANDIHMTSFEFYDHWNFTTNEVMTFKWGHGVIWIFNILNIQLGHIKWGHIHITQFIPLFEYSDESVQYVITEYSWPNWIIKVQIQKLNIYFCGVSLWIRTFNF